MKKRKKLAFLKGDMIMLVYKIDVLAELKKAGYSANYLNMQGIISGPNLQRIRKGVMVGNITLDRLCSLLHKQPGSIIKWIPDEEES